MSCRLSQPLCPSPSTVPRMPLQFNGHVRLSLSEPKFSPSKFRCYSSSSGDNESKSVLDAFFLGKALAEAVNERVESAVGEFLSAVGRLQSEQQKQVQDFQEEVMERAKKAKELAAREAMEAQGVIVPKPSPGMVSASGGDADSVVTDITPTNPSNSTIYGVNGDKGPNDDDSILDVVPIDD